MEKAEKRKYFLNPGYVFIAAEEYEVETILGSCVSVAIWDMKKNIGGMNHYILPEKEKQDVHSGRYGNYSIPFLINELLKIGADIQNMRAAIIGGGKHQELGELVGLKNIEIAKEKLGKYGIKVVKEDTGGEIGRRISFNTFTGNLIIKYLPEKIVYNEIIK